MKDLDMYICIHMFPRFVVPSLLLADAKADDKSMKSQITNSFLVFHPILSGLCICYERERERSPVLFTLLLLFFVVVVAIAFPPPAALPLLTYEQYIRPYHQTRGLKKLGSVGAIVTRTNIRLGRANYKSKYLIKDSRTSPVRMALTKSAQVSFSF